METIALSTGLEVGGLRLERGRLPGRLAAAGSQWPPGLGLGTRSHGGGGFHSSEELNLHSGRSPHESGTPTLGGTIT